MSVQCTIDTDLLGPEAVTETVRLLAFDTLARLPTIRDRQKERAAVEAEERAKLLIYRCATDYELAAVPFTAVALLGLRLHGCRAAL